MSGSLIIDARHRLPWRQRLVSDVSTAIMWAVWLWLWYPLLGSLGWVAHLGVRAHPSVLKLLASGSALDLERYVTALVGTSGTLLMWNRLPSRGVRTVEVRSVTDYARHFALPEHDLAAGRRASVCVVHHDDGGRIVRLECRTASPAGAEVAKVQLPHAYVAEVQVAQARAAEAQVAA